MFFTCNKERKNEHTDFHNLSVTNVKISYILFPGTHTSDNSCNQFTN